MLHLKHNLLPLIIQGYDNNAWEPSHKRYVYTFKCIQACIYSYILLTLYVYVCVYTKLECSIVQLLYMSCPLNRVAAKAVDFNTVISTVSSTAHIITYCYGSVSYITAQNIMNRYNIFIAGLKNQHLTIIAFDIVC